MTEKALRPIIEIDEEKCDGCGQCVLACAEGALEIVDGKARLVGEILCDGLGACIGECPQGALTVIEREARGFDEAAVEEHLKKQKEQKQPPAPKGALLPCGCPSSASVELSPCAGGAVPGGQQTSTLSHWPVKLRLVGPEAPFLKGREMLLLADCAATASPNLHQDFLPGRSVVMGCPKFDDPEAYTQKLAQVLSAAAPPKLVVAVMEVPCCRGFVHVAQKAVEASGRDIPVEIVEIARNGQVLKRESL